jgi:pimeloyl-ACP methyl ester carboxylesterase
MTINLEAETARAESAWNEPEGIGARGTLILLGGRGEIGATYARFGSRIAADAYKVRTITGVADAATARSRVSDLLADESLPSPRILVGSDSGAALALELGAEGIAVDALIVAGLPTGQSDLSGSWDDELEARTACPNHQGVLTRTARKGAIWQSLPSDLLGIVATAIPLPVLAIHGKADVLSAVSRAVKVYEAIPRHEIAIVAGGRHDILNDITHRSVAATVILFLERLRLDPSVTAIVETR